jgi:hypothetical protein
MPTMEAQGNFGVLLLEFWPQGVNGLAKDLEMMENP